VAGDFNADPDQILSTSGMAPNFLDSWPYAGSGSRNTYPASNPLLKLDYLLFDASWGAQPLSSKTTYLSGSDHLAVQATFEVTGSAGPPPPPPPPAPMPVPTGLRVISN
jgi:endonuclease/exonuclease/phosphatase family metal-dependent hydrolase